MKPEHCSNNRLDRAIVTAVAAHPWRIRSQLSSLSGAIRKHRMRRS